MDILPPDGPLDGYKLILTPGMMHMPDALKARLSESGAEVLLGPRSAAREAEFSIPVPLPPAFPGLDVVVTRVESLRPDMPIPLEGGGAATRYLEEIEGAAETVLSTASGTAVAKRAGASTYMAGWGDAEALDRLVADLAGRAGVTTRRLPKGVRIRETDKERFWFNHNCTAVETEAGIVEPAGVLRQHLDSETGCR